MKIYLLLEIKNNMNLSISIIQKRAILIYVIIGLFALLCNKAPLNGTIRKGYPIWEKNGSSGSEMFGHKTINIFTSRGDEYSRPFYDKTTKSFWPITTPIVKYFNPKPDKNGYYYDPQLYSIYRFEGGYAFFGIFNGFDYFEFFVYLFLLLGFIYIPKIW